MAETTVELDTKNEKASPDGHEDHWFEFDDDQAFINHIFAQEPQEKLVEIPEWKMKVLCRALGAEDRIKIQMLAYDKETKVTDYRHTIYDVLMAGCFNPKNGRKAFPESYRHKMMRDHRNGAPIERLFMEVIRLSSMLGSDAEKARKN